MTTTTIPPRTASARRVSVNADLMFWTAAGAVVAALSGPFAQWWHAPRGVLSGVGLALAILGPVLLWWLNRIRPTPRNLVAGFGASNLVLAPLTAATAGFGWLGLSTAGDWALADAAAVMLALGVWQLTGLRPEH